MAAIPINCGTLTKPGSFKIFTEAEIINNFQDVDGDTVEDIFIKELPTFGILKYEEQLIPSNFSFPIKDLENFKYVRISKQQYTDTFKYQVTDNSNNKKLSNMATMTINVNAYSNQPPTIGDNEITIPFGQTKTYTVQNFTTETTPPYSDPEGDGPFKLKITSLPTVGELRFQNELVSINDEILFTDISRGYLTYIPAIDDESGYGDDFFNFEISDLGSQQFSA